MPSGTEAYYSFDLGNVHFVCLDSDGSPKSPGSAMLTWLAADLAANTAKLAESAEFTTWLKGLDAIRKIVSDSIYEEQ